MARKEVGILDTSVGRALMGEGYWYRRPPLIFGKDFSVELLDSATILSCVCFCSHGQPSGSVYILQ